jgi:hypothetical protein
MNQENFVIAYFSAVIISSLLAIAIYFTILKKIKKTKPKK